MAQGVIRPFMMETRMVIASRERVIGRIRDKKKEKTVKRNGYAKERYLKFTITGLCSFYFSFLTTFKLS